MGKPSALLIVLIAPVLFACGSMAGSRPSQPPVEGMSRTRMDQVSGPEGFATFVPFARPIFVGGECQTMPAPMIMGRNPEGSRILQAYFPTMRSTETQVNLTIDADGNVLGYSEIWGVVRSSNPDFEEAMKEIARTRSTTITLDFRTGQAFATNKGGDAPNELVTGTIEEAVRVPLFAAVRDRVDAVLVQCEGAGSP